MDRTEEQARELLRQRSGLAIDREGRFLHRGEPVTHARTLELLWRTLERCPDGRYQVRIGRESGYVEIQDAPYLVRAAAPEPAGVRIWLSDGSQEWLRPETLTVNREGVLHCRVKESHRARFSRAAQVVLGQRIEEDRQASGGYSLVLPGHRWPICFE